MSENLQEGIVAKFLRRSWKGLRLVAVYLYLSVRNIFLYSRVAANAEAVVCMTTHGKRIRKVYLALESIARGTQKPARLILWLDDAKLLEALPSSIRRLQRRGLEVRLSDRNYGPHTKYYPYLLSETTFHAPLVTADDDVIYPRYWLKDLVLAYRQDTSVVHCHRAHVVNIQDGKIAPYETWKACTSQEPKFGNFATGVSGVIYPPRLQAALKAAGDRFMQCCPIADDIWLHVISIRNGFRVRQLGKAARHFLLVPGTQAMALWRRNTGNGTAENDRQAASTYSREDIQILRDEN